MNSKNSIFRMRIKNIIRYKFRMRIKNIIIIRYKFKMRIKNNSLQIISFFKKKKLKDVKFFVFRK